MRSSHHEVKEVRRQLSVRESEGLTYAELSERSGIPVHVLTYRAATDRQAELRGAGGPTGFVEVAVTEFGVAEPSETAGIRLRFGGGVVVELDRDFDVAALKSLLALAQC